MVDLLDEVGKRLGDRETTGGGIEGDGLESRFLLQ
jgi:hypothetical protein